MGKKKEEFAYELTSRRAYELNSQELTSLRANRLGLTLVEILIAITLIAIIAAVGIVAANPAGQVAKARNTRRQLDLEVVMNSIRQSISDTSGATFSCVSGPLPTSTKKMASPSSSYNMAPCLTPTYLGTLPFDPSASGSHWTSVSDYDTGYNIVQNASGVITVAAPSAELNQAISISR